MARSIFDPTGGEMASEGDTFMPGRADNTSQMPPDLVDGKVTDEAADAQVPLKGEAGEDTVRESDVLTDGDVLTEADTRAMAEAAEAAKAKAANSDPAPKADPQEKSQNNSQDDDDVRWLQDI